MRYNYCAFFETQSCFNCKNCFDGRKIMPNINIKITAEVDGKIVPLNTISTESFEAIKALEKPKEIPVARVGHYKDVPTDRRLFLKINESIRQTIKNGYATIAINLQNGCVNNCWQGNDIDYQLYENVKPL